MQQLKTSSRLSVLKQCWTLRFPNELHTLSGWVHWAVFLIYPMKSCGFEEPVPVEDIHYKEALTGPIPNRNERQRLFTTGTNIAIQYLLPEG